ncbi:MAG TPA: hypothetical protein VGK99_03725 [Acidobacteriota bacterium]|jgi:hypothetical protein
MTALLVLLSMPMLYVSQASEKAAVLRQAGIEQFYVPPEEVEQWKIAGLQPAPLSISDLRARTRLKVPGVAPNIRTASPTRRPWVNASGWLFLREASAGKYYYDLPRGKATLAAAEAFVYGADAILKIDPDDVPDASAMLAFLKQIEPDRMEPLADLAVVESDSPLLEEVLNLLVRRNLMFRLVQKPDPRFAINVQIGSAEYPASEAENPSNLALKVRRKLSDENRLLRIYGSEVVIGRVTGDASRIRLHLINYGANVIGGLRVRLRGSCIANYAQAVGKGRIDLEDFTARAGITEFTIPEMPTYVVVDLSKSIEPQRHKGH